MRKNRPFLFKLPIWIYSPKYHTYLLPPWFYLLFGIVIDIIKIAFLVALESKKVKIVSSVCFVDSFGKKGTNFQVIHVNFWNRIWTNAFSRKCNLFNFIVFWSETVEEEWNAKFCCKIIYTLLNLETSLEEDCFALKIHDDRHF